MALLIQEIKRQVTQGLEFLLEQAQPEPGMILVVGCSTSEVVGKKIGTASNEEVAEAIFESIAVICSQNEIHMAFQCCEHLNRALVVEKEVAKRFGLYIVKAVPKPGAGGALASVAYAKLNNPVLVEEIQAQLGMDIGDTFIGMHLQPVLKPVRPPVQRIGSASLTMGYSRPKLIGGERAVYC